MLTILFQIEVLYTNSDPESATGPMRKGQRKHQIGREMTEPRTSLVTNICVCDLDTATGANYNIIEFKQFYLLTLDRVEK